MTWTAKMYSAPPIPYLDVSLSRSISTLDSVRKQLRAVLIESQRLPQSNGKSKKQSPNRKSTPIIFSNE